MIKNNIKNKIKEFFFLNPTMKLRVRQIERTLKVPLPSVIRYTKELEKENILKNIKIANITVYAADRISKEYLIEKKLFNIKYLHKSGLQDFLIEKFSNSTIIVFGSYSKGEDVEDSDIDLFIETPRRQKVDVSKFEKILERPIQIFIYKNIESVQNKELANNIINGITLNGFIEVFK